MSSTALIYLFVKTIEILIIIVCGISISKLPAKFTSSKYWKIAFWAILAYAIGEGLRWGHLVDYNAGYITYDTTHGFLADERNPLWSIINYSFKLFGFSYHFFIFSQCAFLMFSIMVFVKDYHRFAAFIMPLSIIGILMNENFIRWYTAFGILLIGIHYYINNKKIKASVCCILTVLIHFGFLFVIWPFFFYYLLNRWEVKPWIICSVYSAVILFGDVSWITEPMNNISMILMRLGMTQDVNEGFSYLTQTERLLSGDMSEGIRKSSMLAKTADLLINVPVLLWSKKYIKEQIPHFNFYYNVYALGLVLGPLFKIVTLLGRITDIWVFFFCIVGGAFYSTVIKGRKSTLLYFVVILGLLLYFVPYVKNPFSREDRDMYYLWDSNGQEYNKSYL